MALGVTILMESFLPNNLAGLAKTASVFDTPVVLSTIAEIYDGPLFLEISEVIQQEG